MDAYQMGIDRGWDHQNYVEAYGPTESNSPDYPASLEPDSRYGFSGPKGRERAEGRRQFAKGWAVGRRYYRQNRWQDGTKMEG